MNARSGKWVLTAAAAAAAVWGAAALVGQSEVEVPPPLPELPDGLYAVWETPRGRLIAELFPDDAPLAVANFVGLAEGVLPNVARPVGEPYFDGLVFHRVVPGFVVQGGDPLGNGMGGPGYVFADEFTPRRKHARGALAMANAGPHTNGSQFYFTHAAVHRLNYKHTVFGQLVDGFDTLLRLEAGDPMTRVRIVRRGPAAEAYRVDAAEFAAARVDRGPIAPRPATFPPLFAHEAEAEVFPEGMVQWQSERLHHYHATTGRQVLVRTAPRYAALPAVAEGDARAALQQYFAQVAGEAAPQSALVLFFTEEATFRLWFGEALLAHLGVAPEELETEAGRMRLEGLKKRILAPARVFLEGEAPRPDRALDRAIVETFDALDAGAAFGAGDVADEH